MFALAKQRFTVHLRPEDVLSDWPGARGALDGDRADAVRPAVEQLVPALDKLVEWGNLCSDAAPGG